MVRSRSRLGHVRRKGFRQQPWSYGGCTPRAPSPGACPWCWCTERPRQLAPLRIVAAVRLRPTCPHRVRSTRRAPTEGLASHQAAASPFEHFPDPPLDPPENRALDGTLADATCTLHVAKKACSATCINGLLHFDAVLVHSGSECRWCRIEESNPRPSHYKCAALPTELIRHAAGIIALAPRASRRAT